MFSYVAKSLLSKTLRAFLRKYLENIELESINYGYGSADSKADTSKRDADDGGGGGSSASSGWGVRLSNVKLREGMELMKLPGKYKHKRIITRKRKVKKNREMFCPNSDFVSTPIAKNSATGITQSEVDRGGGEESRRVLQAHHPTDFDDSDISTCEDHTTVSRRDSENGYCSSTSTSPIQSNRLLCRLPSNCRSVSTKEAEKWQTETESNDILADESESCTQGLDNHSNFLLSDYSELNCNIEGEDDDMYIEIDEEVVIEEDLSLVVGAGGSIGTLNIKYIGKDLHVTIEDAHLIVEAIPTNEPNQKDDKDATTSPRSNAKHDLPSASDVGLPAETTDQKKSTIGEKIEEKSIVARYLSLIPHLFLRDCRLTLIFPEETGYDENVPNSCDDCTILEFGIDFLSVTSGDDFVDTLRVDSEHETTEGTKPLPQPNLSESRTCDTPSSYYCASSQRFQTNIFSRKRIRTGKGPDGGVWLKIQPPLGKNNQQRRSRQPEGVAWARERFLDFSQSYFLRCSGLDFQARLLADRVDVVHDVSYAWSNEYDEYTLDSMLFGVDYVDPMSLTRHQIKKNMKKSEYLKREPPDIMIDVDSNGIQSIPFASNHHWIAQRAHRSHCKSSHLPLNQCYSCLSKCAQSESVTSTPSIDRIRERNMNKLMPLPGFVFCLSISDPLEMNVDISSIRSLGYINSLFTARYQKSREEKGSVPTSSGSIRPEKSSKANDTISSTYIDEESFPSFMQPYAVYLSSLSVSNLTIRVEAIRQKCVSSYYHFRFWQFQCKSIYYEESQIDAEEQFVRDTTIHVGSMECRDFTGVCEKTLFKVAGDEDTTSAVPSVRSGKVILPCTAARVIGAAHLASKNQRTSNSYAFHLRLIQSDFPSTEVSQKLNSKVSYVDLRMGLTNINVDDKLIGDVSDAIDEATSILFRGPNTTEIKGEIPDRDSKRALNWLCQVSMEGGIVSYTPHIRMVIPQSPLRLRMGPEGFSFETLLHSLSIEYGSYSFKKPTVPSIMLFCSLPESLRMHILLYLNDLSPLEEVLNVKMKKQSLFLRSHALSKRLASMSRSPLAEETRSTLKIIRRNQLLDRLQSLETDTLETLLAMHMRSIKVK